MPSASRVLLMVLTSITVQMLNARGQMEGDDMLHLRVYVLYPWHPPHVQLCYSRSAIDMWVALKSTGPHWRGPSLLLLPDCFCMSQSLQDIRTPFTAVAAPSVCKRPFACFFLHRTKCHQSFNVQKPSLDLICHLHGRPETLGRAVTVRFHLHHRTNHLHHIRILRD